LLAIAMLAWPRLRADRQRVFAARSSKRVSAGGDTILPDVRIVPPAVQLTMLAADSGLR